MASEIGPSKEITDGDWYCEGNLDEEFIDIVKHIFLKHIFVQKVATVDGILEWINKNKVFSVEFTSHHIEEILRALVLDDQIIEMKSTEFEKFDSVPVGGVYYQCKNKSVHSTPDGIISPKTCAYYQKWVDF